MSFCRVPQELQMMGEAGQTAPERVLDPLERSSEIMFGVIMALTFTCSVSVVASTPDVRTMLLGALGCNLAWGFIDAAMYVLGELVCRQRQRLFLIRISEASPPEARQIILEALPEGLDRHLKHVEIDRLVHGVKSLPRPSENLWPRPEDLQGALGIFLLVFSSTFPIALPFLIIGKVSTALRVSNAIAVAALLLVGTQLGRYMGWHSPRLFGLAVALFGSALVAVAIALGG